MISTGNDEHARPTRNDILQDKGAAVERLNHPRNLGMTPMADRFYCAESSGESIWSAECLRIERVHVERALKRITIWWHDVGVRPRLAATLY